MPASTAASAARRFEPGRTVPDRAPTRSVRRRDQQRRRVVGARVPGARTVSDEHELGAVGDGVGGGRLFGPHLAGIVAAEPFGVGAVHHGEVQRRVEPARPGGHELRIDRQAWREREARVPRSRSRSTSTSGHGRSGLTWSAVTGETPPQSSMPASIRTPKSSVRLGGAWRWTSARQDQARRGDGPEIVVARALPDAAASPCVPSAGSSGRSPPARGRGGDGSRRSLPAPASRSARVSPMPTRIPVVKGIDSSPAASSVAKRRAGALSGAPRCASRSSATDSIIMPWLGLTGRSGANSSACSAPALACGSRPVSPAPAPPWRPRSAPSSRSRDGAASRERSRSGPRDARPA